MFESSYFFYAVGLFLSIFASVWSLAWWLSGKFNQVNALIYNQIEKLNTSFMQKLDYHEKHDDTRFTDMSNRFASVRDDIWDIRVRNAAFDGTVKPTKATV